MQLLKGSDCTPHKFFRTISPSSSLCHQDIQELLIRGFYASVFKDVIGYTKSKFVSINRTSKLR